MEMAQQDKRRELSARIEYMEEEVFDLQQILADKKEQEKAMLEVLMQVEQEQKVTKDARISAERDAAAQRYLASVLKMEKRVVMAESMLEATLQYNSGQVKPQVRPGAIRPESMKDNTTNAHTRKTGLLHLDLVGVIRIRFMPQGVAPLCADSSGSVLFWNSLHRTLLQADSCHKGDVNALAASPNQ